MASPLLEAGRIEDVIHVGLIAHHLIAFSRSCYSDKPRPLEPVEAR